ncbi:hypothetical protein D3C86_2106650 [compost metagenome]
MLEMALLRASGSCCSWTMTVPPSMGFPGADATRGSPFGEHPVIRSREAKKATMWCLVEVCIYSPTS